MGKSKPNSDLDAKGATIQHLERNGFKIISNKDPNFQRNISCDIQCVKNGKIFYFEVKSSSRNKNEAYGGTVMLTELYAGITNENYRFIVCKGKGEDHKKWDFKVFTVDKFMELCALTTPLLRYAYHPDEKKQPQFRKTTRKADKGLIKDMWEDYNRWKVSPNEPPKDDECFYNKGRTKFFDNEKERYVAKYSKEHTTGNIKYWYGISEVLYEQMKEQKLTHVFFYTENDGIIKLPISKLDEYLKTANVTIDTNKEKMYQLYVKPIDDELYLYSAGKSEIPLKEYIT